MTEKIYIFHLVSGVILIGMLTDLQYEYTQTDAKGLYRVAYPGQIVIQPLTATKTTVLIVPFIQFVKDYKNQLDNFFLLQSQILYKGEAEVNLQEQYKKYFMRLQNEVDPPKQSFGAGMIVGGSKN